MRNLTGYKLLLPKIHPQTTDFAVAELVEIMAKCSLSPLEVVYEKPSSPFISLGNTDAFAESGLKADENKGGGYNITSVGDSVYIYSLEPSGILNGVYGFCETVLGYRFYAMDEIKVEVKDEYLVPDFAVSDKPDFMGRKLDTFALYTDSLYSARLRQNGSCRGVENEYHNGEGSLWSVLQDHSLNGKIMPLSEYKTEETIKKGWWSEKGEQLCWTKAYYDEELFEILSNRVIDFVKAEPTKTFYMIGQADDYDYCTCEDCKKEYEKYSVSGVFIRLVNKLADKVKEFVDREQGGREHYLVMFAYQQTSDPPVKVVDNKIVPLDESVIARDNVVIRFAPVESNLLYAHTDKQSNPIATLSFTGWKAVAKKVAIWDYGTDFHAYLVPFPDWDVLGKNMRFWKEYGAIDILTQLPAHTIGTEFNAMKLFVRAQLTWRVDQDEHALMDEFISAYYGSAQGYIHEYLDILRKHYARINRENGYTGHIFVDYNLGFFWPLPLLKKIEKLFNKAKKSLTETGERKSLICDRLDRETIWVRHIMLASYLDFFSTREMDKMLREFIALTEKNNVIAWKNGWRWGAGKIDDFIENRRTRIELIKRAKKFTQAENNPLLGNEYYKVWEE